MLRFAMFSLAVLGLGALRAGAAEKAIPPGGPPGTWYFNGNGARLTIVISKGAKPGTFAGRARPEGEGPQTLDRVSWDATTRRLEFRRVGKGWWQWYRGTLVEG